MDYKANIVTISDIYTT